MKQVPEWKLCERTEENVIVFYDKTKEKEVQKGFPKSVSSLEEALMQFQNSKKNKISYGKTIYIGKQYIGDIWCYRIHQEEEPDAMLSYCIFEREFWNQGIATAVVKQFLEDITERFDLKSVGAFTYSSNQASIRVLEKNNFLLQEVITEDEIESKYFIYRKSNKHLEV